VGVGGGGWGCAAKSKCMCWSRLARVGFQCEGRVMQIQIICVRWNVPAFCS
jgi:hypothetical protein